MMARPQQLTQTFAVQTLLHQVLLRKQRLRKQRSTMLAPSTTRHTARQRSGLEHNNCDTSNWHELINPTCRTSAGVPTRISIKQHAGLALETLSDYRAGHLGRSANPTLGPGALGPALASPVFRLGSIYAFMGGGSPPKIQLRSGSRPGALATVVFRDACDFAPVSPSPGWSG